MSYEWKLYCISMLGRLSEHCLKSNIILIVLGFILGILVLFGFVIGDVDKDSYGGLLLKKIIRYYFIALFVSSAGYIMIPPVNQLTVLFGVR